MNLGLFGVGKAGMSVVESLIMTDSHGDVDLVEMAIAFDTDQSTLDELDILPQQYRVLVGEDRVKGHGTGASPELGADVFKDDMITIQRRLDEVPLLSADIFVIVAGLGGGTGGGGAPILAKSLSNLYPSRPLLGLGILPADDEGQIYRENANETLPDFVENADTVLLFDIETLQWNDDGSQTELTDIIRTVQSAASVPE